MSLVSLSPGWLWRFYVAEVGLALLFLWPLPPDCWSNRYGLGCLCSLLLLKFQSFVHIWGSNPLPACCVLRRFLHNLQLFNFLFKITLMYVPTAWWARASTCVEVRGQVVKKLVHVAQANKQESRGKVGRASALVLTSVSCLKLLLWLPWMLDSKVQCETNPLKTL